MGPPLEIALTTAWEPSASAASPRGVRLTVERIHRLGDDPVLAARVEAELRAAVRPDGGGAR